MRLNLLYLVLAIALAAVGCGAPTATGRSPLPAPALGTPGAPGTSRSDLARTIDEMQARLRKNPDDAASSIRLGEALLRQARVAGHSAPAVKAEQVLRALLGRASDLSGTHQYQAERLLAATLASQHRFDEAIREAERCLQVRQDDAVLYGIIGDSRLELGDRDGAFAAFDRMVSIRPDEASYARISYARELAGDRQGAITVMTMALEATSPNDVESLAWHHAQLGGLQLAAGQLDTASREFDHAAFLFPEYPLALEGQARVAYSRGQHAAALAFLNPLLAGTPTSSVLALSSDVLRALGRPDDAARNQLLAEAARAMETAATRRPGLEKEAGSSDPAQR